MPAAAAAPQVRLLRVGEESAGQRLDNFLIRELKGVPKTHVYRIIRAGEVRVNKGRVSAERRVELGDEVRIPPVRVAARPAASTGDSEGGAARVPAREFPLLFEDEHLLAIDKPAGVAVHGGSGVSFGVIEQLRMARPQARFLELVHRLDRETSGILLVACRRSALTKLQEQFRARATGKTYLALVIGRWPAKRKLLDSALQKYLLPDGERRVRVVAADHPDAMPAVSQVQVLRASEAWSLLAVTIRTGRTHQIRVHLAGAGHPIMGDDKYGDFALNRQWQTAGAGVPLRRMFLHAWRLQFVHPATGETIRLQAELPPELAAFLAQELPSPPSEPVPP